jgi:outer membrane protein OmpA-like peptidoglycan-associated protein
VRSVLAPGIACSPDTSVRKYMTRRSFAQHLLQAGACLTTLPGSAFAAASSGGDDLRYARRVATIIGNAGYRYVDRLRNPTRDAALIGASLQALQFNLTGNGPLFDLTRSGIEQGIAEFGRSIQGADIALLYYAGHGVEINGSNWLVPVDAHPTEISDVHRQMIAADSIVQQMNSAGTRFNVLVLDACRDNPFPPLRGLNGLAPMRASPGTIVAFSTQPGQVALDGDGQNSPYAKALNFSMRMQGVELQRTFNTAGALVARWTNEQQLPWTSSTPILGEFYFSGNARSAIKTRFLLFWDFNSVEITPIGMRIVEEAADTVLSAHAATVEVNGYDDAASSLVEGSKSQQRATTVAAALVRLGVPPQKITARGLGAAIPFVAVVPEVREPQNRRVEILLR